jgi:hypothetical protein
MKPELHHTLFELIGRLDSGESGQGIVGLESLEVRAPVTVSWQWDREGIHLLASPPSTAFRTGIEPVVQPLTVTAVAMQSEDWPESGWESDRAGQG